MLSRAQKYLGQVALVLFCLQIMAPRVELAYKMLNDHHYSHENSFVEGFFSKTEPSTNNDLFVAKFNSFMLDIHIDSKKESKFISVSPLGFSTTMNCTVCNTCNFTEVDDCTFCDSCGLLTRSPVAVAWADVTRIHASPNYSYDRKLQFKEFLLQFQGKCSLIDYSILDNMIGKYRSKLDFLHALKNIRKQRINIEQIHALYYRYNMLPCPDLSWCENMLLNDFDKFINAYSSKTSVSNQTLVYQFLNRYGVKTSRDDVLLCETISNYDENFTKTFLKLGWKVF